MSQINKRLAPFGIQAAEMLIPSKGVDSKKWAVIACDQYSSEPEYWEKVNKEVGDAPSSLNLIFPECYLEKGNDDQIIASINEKMQEYIKSDLLESTGEAFVLIKRTLRSGAERWGLMAVMDLEDYDFNKGSTSLIRATEGTIIDRIPPRLKIRKDAGLELPHIMVLVDDQKAPLIEPLKSAVEGKTPLYQTDLLENSGTLTGYKIDDEALLNQFADSLEVLADKAAFKKTYGSDNPLLFAIGDGNHSLATAKTQWENIKKDCCPCSLEDHPARYALVELNTIYDAGIEFEPIHRVVFEADGDQFLKDFSEAFDVDVADAAEADMAPLAESIPEDQQFILITKAGLKKVTVKNPDTNLMAGTWQQFADKWLEKNSDAEIDYIHGVESTLTLATKGDNFGIILPNISKATFFETVIRDGSFPRKTFSMGEAHEKRFYFEARKIK